MTKLREVCVPVALMVLGSSAAVADTSGSVGIMSDYIWRGQYVSDASAYASIDLEADSGFYLGAWGADIQNGIEYDVYLGYVGGTENVSWNIGFTGYYATDEAFDTLEEINLGFSAGFFDFQYSLGDFDNPLGALPSGTEVAQTYSYAIVTFQPDFGPYYIMGRGDYKNINPQDAPALHATGSKGMWFEIGKDFDVGDDGLVVGISAIYSPDVALYDGDPTPRSVVLSAVNPAAEYAIVGHVTKHFQIGN